MKIGIYGGTFSPVHNGHVRAATLFLEKAQLDRLLIMPAGIPPHKAVEHPVQSHIRFEMCKVAFEGISDKIVVSDYEINRAGKSYTVETVEHYIDMGEICVLCGEDMICSLDTWHRAKDLMKMCSFYTIAREHGGENRVTEASEKLRNEYGASVTVMCETPVTVSSTEIRNAVSKGEDIFGLVPRKVYEIIEKYELYR